MPSHSITPKVTFKARVKRFFLGDDTFLALYPLKARLRYLAPFIAWLAFWAVYCFLVYPHLPLPAQMLACGLIYGILGSVVYYRHKINRIRAKNAAEWEATINSIRNLGNTMKADMEALEEVEKR